jgi:hypothetical protein
MIFLPGTGFPHAELVEARTTLAASGAARGLAGDIAKAVLRAKGVDCDGRDT